MTPVQEELLKRYVYDPDEPLAFRWRIAPWRSRTKAGDIAGYWHAIRAGSSLIERYVEVRIEGKRKRIPAHFAVWIYHHGTLPERPVTWRNGDRSDCRLPNLMEEPQRRTARQYTLWNQWRLTVDEYARLFQAQSGVCAICEKPETGIRVVPHCKAERAGRPDSLALDHCHANGHLRGLLCHKCNRALGLFQDSPELLGRAMAYLEKHREEHRGLPPKPPRKAMRKKQPDPKPGRITGVYPRGNRWRAVIFVDYTRYNLGTFATAEAAQAAYIKAAAELRHHTAAAHNEIPSTEG